MSKLFPTKKDAYHQGVERGVDLGIDQGVTLERERIIKLLEDRRNAVLEFIKQGHMPMKGPVETYSNAIELIKEETNG